MIQAALGVGNMPVGGRIINIGSTATKQGPYGAPVYVAAKAAQDCIAVAWAGEVREIKSPDYLQLLTAGSLAVTTESPSTRLHRA